MLHNYLHCLCMAKNKMLRNKAACDKPLLVAAEVFAFLSLLLEFPVTSVALNSNSGEHCWNSQPLPLSSPLLSSPAGNTHTRCSPLQLNALFAKGSKEKKKRKSHKITVCRCLCDAPGVRRMPTPHSAQYFSIYETLHAACQRCNFSPSLLTHR